MLFQCFTFDLNRPDLRKKIGEEDLLTLPVEVHLIICELDSEVYKLYPLLSKATAATRFSSNLEKIGTWRR
jgi:hypothetical protein